MNFKQQLATHVGKMTYSLLRLFKRNGGSYPGQLALKIDPSVLETLANDYETVVITGTNGKTLTTALTAQALRQKYPHLLTNSTGSNMIQGIVSSFLTHKVPQGEKKVAILEVDEAYLSMITPHLKPKVIVTTNIFRDQMDRFGEIYSTYDKIVDGIKKSPTSIVLANGDMPIFNSVPFPNERRYFGFEHEKDGDMPAPYNVDGILCPHCHSILRYRYITYASQGKYYCPNHDYERPALDFAVSSIDRMDMRQSTFTIDNYQFTIPVTGVYNIYNALAAYSVARLFDISPSSIQEAFTKANRVFGRQEIVDVNGKQVLINLIKNPVGFNQVVDVLNLDQKPVTLIALLNDNYADGQDVSWIWDGEFENLTRLDVQQLIVGGLRQEDLTLRLEVAGFDREAMIQLDDLDTIISTIQQSPTQDIYVLATYTAMLDIRKKLTDAGFTKGIIS